MKRKKKEKSFSAEYFPTVVWLEDLEEIVEIVRRDAREVEITTDDYSFETLDDAAAHFGSRPQHNLMISASGPYSYVEFTRLWTRAYVSSGDHSAKKYHELDEVLRRCQRRLPYLYSFWIPIVFGGANAAASSYILTKEQVSSVWYVAPIAMLTGWWLWVSFVRLRRNSVVIFQKRAEAKTFMERNKDQVLMIVIGAILGGLLTFVGTAIKDRFFPTTVTDQKKGS